MTSHNLSSIWPQNTIQSIGPFNQAIASLNQLSDWYFSPIDCIFIQAIVTFQASDFQSQVYSSDCYIIPSVTPQTRTYE